MPAKAATNASSRSGSLNRRVWYTLLLLLFCQAGAVAQNLDQRITVVVNQLPLQEVLKLISRQANIDFSYSQQVIKANRPVTLEARRRTVREVLDELLRPQGIEYVIVENQVILRPAQSPTRVTPVSAPPAQYTISGYLRDLRSGEVLIGATVSLEGGTRGTFTNDYGFYSITLPGGNHQVKYSYVGYQPQLFEITLVHDTVMDGDLAESTLTATEVEIVANSDDEHHRNIDLNEFSFSRKTMSRMPGFAGSVDVIRALQAIPGIQTFGDGSSLYFVRGGGSDQNLLLIDEVPVYNPSHLFGFFSAFSPDAINDVKVYKGDFPAGFGGRLSSVIDIKAREGNMKHFGVSGNVGPYATHLSLEGPIVKNRASFFISGRVSTINWINSLIKSPLSFDASFFDINAKFNVKAGDRNRFFFTFYTGRDYFERTTDASFRTYGIRWDNLAGTVRWNHLFSNRLFSNTTLNYSRYNYRLYISTQQDDYWVSEISNITLKSDLAWYLNAGNTLRGGVEISSRFSNPGNVIFSKDYTGEPAPEVSRYHAMEYVLYVGNEQHLGRRLLLQYGVRLPLWQDLGPTNVYYFNVNHQVSDTMQVSGTEVYDTYFSPEPRISMRFTISPSASLSASYTRMTQFMQLLSNSVSPFTSLEVWVPAGPNIAPQLADQFTLGAHATLKKPQISLSAEGYYKHYTNHLDYKDHANLLYNPLLEGELRFGKAWSYGVEMMVRKNKGRLTGWIGYTWSRSWVETPGVNGGDAYPASWDRPHNICINLAYNAKRHWSFTANWIYLTGGAITTPTGFYYINGVSVPLYGAKNNDRLPDYHRLDLSATYAFSKPDNRFQHSLTLTLYNAYGRLNPFSINYNKMQSESGSYVVPSNLLSPPTLITTSLSVAGIIPSINYLFRF